MVLGWRACRENSGTSLISMVPRALKRPRCSKPPNPQLPGCVARRDPWVLLHAFRSFPADLLNRGTAPASAQATSTASAPHTQTQRGSLTPNPAACLEPTSSSSPVRDSILASHMATWDGAPLAVPQAHCTDHTRVAGAPTSCRGPATTNRFILLHGRTPPGNRSVAEPHCGLGIRKSD